MSCEEISELLAAYAVDALDGEETREVRAHLSTCRKHDEALADFESVVSSLSASVEEREPAPELRARLLRAFDEELAAQRSAPTREPARFVPFVRRPAFAWLAAAALFLAVVGLTTWNVVLQTNDSGDEGWTVSAQLAGSGVSGHFWYLDRQQLAVVKMDEMPPLESGRVYQAWAIYGGKSPVSLGVMPHETTVAMKADLAGASTFAITEEPTGGSQQPTGDPIATADIS